MSAGDDQQPLFESHLRTLPLAYRGKVRDLYAVGENHLLLVASDRISAFDVVMPTPIPGKGVLLTQISNFWFQRFARRVRNHLAELPLESLGLDAGELAQLDGRAVVARRLHGLPVEAIVRGYLIGSGWKDYQRTGAICGIAFPRGLRLAEQLPEPVFTPSTKAAQGEHDQNIDFDQVVELVGWDVAEQVRELSLQIYAEAAAYARERGIIIADTKLEFGLDENGDVMLMDEVLTPDSSRFWPVAEWSPGANPPSFDKQFVRDYLETLDWNKRAPGPTLPADIVERTAKKYREAVHRLTGVRQPPPR